MVAIKTAKQGIVTAIRQNQALPLHLLDLQALAAVHQASQARAVAYRDHGDSAVMDQAGLRHMTGNQYQAYPMRTTNQMTIAKNSPLQRS